MKKKTVSAISLLVVCMMLLTVMLSCGKGNAGANDTVANGDQNV